MIGEVITFDGGVPPGWLECFGQAIDSAAFCELVALIGTATLRQRAGRVDACWDPGYGILGNVVGTTVGASAGAEIIYLAASELPGHTHSGTTGSMNRSNPHHHSYAVVNNSQQKPLSGGIAAYTDVIGANTGDTDINHEHGFGTNAGDSPLGTKGWHANMQPTIITRKLIRAC